MGEYESNDPRRYLNVFMWSQLLLQIHIMDRKPFSFSAKILFMSCILSRINKIYRFCWYTGMIDRINWKILSLLSRIDTVTIALKRLVLKRENQLNIMSGERREWVLTYSLYLRETTGCSIKQKWSWNK